MDERGVRADGIEAPRDARLCKKRGGLQDRRETDMRRYLLAALLTFAGGALAHAQTLDQQERYAMLDQRERCAMQAKQSFEEIRARQAQELKGSRQTAAVYQSYYHRKTRKCLALIKTIYYMSNGAISNFATLIDANERRAYATYWEKSDATTSFCELTPSLHEKTNCTVRQFDKFVAGYLEE